jgi:hypothetical protein
MRKIWLISITPTPQTEIPDQATVSMRYTIIMRSKAPDTPEGVIEAQDHALEDIFRHYSEDLLRAITPPRMTSCIRFESWKWLRDHRAIRTPQDETLYTYRDRKRKIRGPKRNSRLEDALEFLDGTDLFY